MNGAGAEGFGTWNNEVKEPRRDRDQRQRERKSRWGDAEPEEAADTNIPELETCDAPPPVTDNTDMDIEAEAPESEVPEPAGMVEPQLQESVPSVQTEPEQPLQPQTAETSFQEEQTFQSLAQESAAPDIQENDHIAPSESMQPPPKSDFDDVVENLMPAPETSDEVSEGVNIPSERLIF